MTIDSAVTLTKQGIACHKAGDIPAATRALVQAVQADPAYEMAWLWLSSCLPTPGEKCYCLNQALRANEQSAPARNGLAQLGDVQWIMPSVLAAQPIAPPPELMGAAKPVKTVSRVQTLAILCVVGLLSLCWFANMLNGRGGAAAYQPDAFGAFVICQHFVKDRLKSPATAVFPLSTDTQTDHLSTVQFRNHAYVDSQNGFGANIRTHYTCTVSSTGGENWHLDDLTTDP